RQLDKLPKGLSMGISIGSAAS
ncbi:unnamed protein product, partial [Rotaria sordida]